MKLLSNLVKLANIRAPQQDHQKISQWELPADNGIGTKISQGELLADNGIGTKISQGQLLADNGIGTKISQWELPADNGIGNSQTETSQAEDPKDAGKLEGHTYCVHQ